MKRIACLALLLFSLIPRLAQATTYWVKTTGSDSNTCVQAQSSSTPKLTPHAGAACLAGGDTLKIVAGTYAMTAHTCSNGAVGGLCIPTAANGSSGAHTIITAVDSGGTDCTWCVKLKGASLQGIAVNYANYLEFRGFEVSGESGTNDYAFLGYTALNEFIHHNYMHDIDAGYSCVAGQSTILVPMATDPGGTGNYEIYDNLVVGKATLAACAATFQQHGIYLPYGAIKAYNNIVARTKSVGIHGYHKPVGLNVYENTVINAGTVGILVIGTASPGLPAASVQIENNLVYACATSNAGIKLTGTDGSNTNLIKNNLIYKCTASSGSVSGSNGQIIADSSVVISGNVTTLTATQESNLFVNYQADGTGDYHLTASSPALDIGLTLGSPYNVDYGANSRPQNSVYDTGAFERVTASPPAAPVITAFTATPASITSGSNTTIAWTTTNATSCQGTGGVAAWQATQPTAGSLVFAPTQTSVFALTCSGPTAPAATANVTVTVTNPPTVTLTQTRYLWSESGGTANSLVSIFAVGENQGLQHISPGASRLRIKIANSGTQSITSGYVLYYSSDGGTTYAPVPLTCNASNPVCLTSFPLGTNYQATTRLLTTDQTAFVGGYVVFAPNSTPSITLTGSGSGGASETELDFAVGTANGLTLGNTYKFRVQKEGGQALDAYTATPQISIVGGSMQGVPVAQ